jgi:hypothetical protein
MKSFFSPEIFAKINGKEIMQILKENYEPDDYVIITDASRQDYLYNSAAQGFYTKKYGIINLSTNIFGHEKILDSLPRGKSYWFYCGYDYAKSPVIPLIKKWKNNKKVLAEIETTGAYLLKVQY